MKIDPPFRRKQNKNIKIMNHCDCIKILELHEEKNCHKMDSVAKASK